MASGGTTEDVGRLRKAQEWLRSMLIIHQHKAFDVCWLKLNVAIPEIFQKLWF